jgi:histidinol-phosphatase (PHP family)
VTSKDIAQAPDRYLFSLHGGHSLFDGTGSLEEFAEAAVRQEMLVFGFSEHMPRPAAYLYPNEQDPAALRAAFSGYIKRARRVQDLYRGRLEILVGVELELIPGLESFLTDVLEEFQPDYAVGSVHFVRDTGFDYSATSYAQAVEACGGMEGFCLEYLDTMEGMLNPVRFEVLGHFDLFKVFHSGPLAPSERVLARIEDLMQCIARRGLLLDLNARGLNKPCRAIYPSLEILQIARAAGVAAALGDDSHAPAEVGQNLDRVLDHARAAGYSELCCLHAGGARSTLKI